MQGKTVILEEWIQRKRERRRRRGGGESMKRMTAGKAAAI